ncbi:non-canonical purine NTP pyrophosphatase [uncultured Rummeliibacillus sp.]|uniref:non-canonical purine NTP pyrophosphatase n=1 Tax=uncultured Rummeliibacillus sp. TaxID=762292 RepID=UPI002613C302|nr:non-canonical purine NTP pyrophosphatase [uncultured Rummeliibacillus sp.]
MKEYKIEREGTAEEQMMKLGLVTSNIGKYEEFKRTLKKIENLELILIDNISNSNEGSNIEKNAQTKALTGSMEVTYPVIATDEGLFLDFLPKSEQPGAYISRIIGPYATDEEIIEHYTNLIGENKTGTGTIMTSYVIAFEDKIINKGLYVQECIFKTPASSARITGRPLASLHYSEEFNKFYSELSAKEKQYMNNDFYKEIVKFVLQTLKI